MSSFQWIKAACGMELRAENELILTIPATDGCTDAFEPIGEGAWKWVRTSEAPTDNMKMTVCHAEPVTFWQVPAVNYNGNGWGSGAQYSGYEADGEVWTYAWHRVAIPACTYAESAKWTVSLFGGEEGGMSCSIWAEDDCARQALIWPETEGPKVLFKRAWRERYVGSMEPRTTFEGIIKVANVVEPKIGVRDLLDFAWKYFERPVTMPWSPEQLVKLDTLWFRQLWFETIDGLSGFASGKHWDRTAHSFVRTTTFECGWVGQNISLACMLLRGYIMTGEVFLRDRALAALDSWVKHGVLPNGMIYARLVADPSNLESIVNGDIPMVFDACNMGTAATYFFQAAALCEKAGIDRPEYLKTAMGLSDFFMGAMKPNGELAKSWFMDGSVDSAHGSVGCFAVIPLFEAYRVTGDKKYLDAALKSYNFYFNEFHNSGVTTAGALDSFCIDKESAAPIIRTALIAYHVTGDKKYVEQAEEVAYYLSTWQWHYSINFPEGSMCKELGVDSYGSTAVSAAHNALDHYGVYYVPEFLELAELTGKDVWRSRARALWYNGSQLISDGTLVINGKVRPAGSQDESIRHTRWGRPDNRYFITSEWLTSWQGTYRQVALELVKDWDQLR